MRNRLLIPGAVLLAALICCGVLLLHRWSAEESLDRNPPPASPGEIIAGAPGGGSPHGSPGTAPGEGRQPGNVGAGGERAQPEDAAPSPDSRGEPGGPLPKTSTTTESIVGQVLGTEGSPVAGASIRLSPETRRSGIQDRMVRTADTGRFEIRGLAPGPWFLSARHPERLTVAEMRLEVPSPGPVLVMMAPDRPAPLRVVDEAGNPLAGVRITARISGRPLPRTIVPSIRTSTGPDGKAELRRLPGEDSIPISVQAAHPERPPVSITRTAGELRRDGLVIEMGAGGVLGGIVLNPEGEPQANVKLILVPDPSAPASARKTLHSTAGGLFRFRGIPGGLYTLFADGGEKGLRRIPGLQVKEGDREEQEIEVRLFPAGSREARDASPPPPRITVRKMRTGGGIPGTGTIRGLLRTEGTLPAYSIGLTSQSSGSDIPERIYRQTGRRPAFRIDNVPAGTYRVLLLVDGEVRASAEGVKVVAGQEASQVELSLEGS